MGSVMDYHNKSVLWILYMFNWYTLFCPEKLVQRRLMNVYGNYINCNLLCLIKQRVIEKYAQCVYTRLMLTISYFMVFFILAKSDVVCPADTPYYQICERVLYFRKYTIFQHSMSVAFKQRGSS